MLNRHEIKASLIFRVHVTTCTGAYDLYVYTTITVSILWSLCLYYNLYIYTKISISMLRSLCIYYDLYTIYPLLLRVIKAENLLAILFIGETKRSLTRFFKSWFEWLYPKIADLCQNAAQQRKTLCPFRRNVVVAVSRNGGPPIQRNFLLRAFALGIRFLLKKSWTIFGSRRRTHFEKKF